MARITSSPGEKDPWLERLLVDARNDQPTRPGGFKVYYQSETNLLIRLFNNLITVEEFFKNDKENWIALMGKKHFEWTPEEFAHRLVQVLGRWGDDVQAVIEHEFDHLIRAEEFKRLYQLPHLDYRFGALPDGGTWIPRFFIKNFQEIINTRELLIAWYIHMFSDPNANSEFDLQLKHALQTAGLF